MAFEPNEGQTDAAVRYMAHGRGYTLFLTEEQAVISLVPNRRHTPHAVVSRSPSAVLQMQVVDAQPQPVLTAEQPLPGYSNYYIGDDPGRWRDHVAHYQSVRYRAVRPGVDMVFHGEPERLEFDFVIAPGADPAKLAVRLIGASQVSLDKGDLVLATAAGPYRLRQPVAYQESHGEKQLVAAAFVVRGDEIGFDLGPYDSSRELVIDPVLSYTAYLGGSAEDRALGLAADAGSNVNLNGQYGTPGSAYVTGETASTDFPLAPTYGGGAHDAFVTRVAPDGSVLWTVFLGGAGDDVGNGIWVNQACISPCPTAVVGNTEGMGFPAKTKVGKGGGQDAFVALLDGNGIVLTTTLIGGSGTESGNAVSEDAAGNVFVAGGTDSTDLPVTSNAAQSTLGGGEDAFVAKLDLNAANPFFLTYLGGANDDVATGVGSALLPLAFASTAYVTGTTSSPGLATAGAADATCGTDGNCDGGASDSFVASIDGSGSRVYFTYIGGSGAEQGGGMTTDPSTGVAFVVGTTSSSDLPLAGVPVQTTYGGGTSDAFVAQVDATGTYFPVVSYYGGSGADLGQGIVRDSSKNVYITGTTSSSDFPLQNPLSGSTSLSGSSDAFVAEMNKLESNRVFSTYLGGSGDDGGAGVGVDGTGNIFVAGSTTSSNLPAALGSYAGGTDAFVSMISSNTGYDVTVNPKTTVVSRGQLSLPMTVTVASINGFSSGVTLQCLGLPLGALCNFNPKTVTPPSNGSGVSALTVTTSNIARAEPPGWGKHRGPMYAMILVLPGAMLIGGVWTTAVRRKRAATLAGIILIGSLLGLTSCSKNSGTIDSPGLTPFGTYTITVVATQGSTILNRNFTLTVQQ
jgi:hypothetical protein